MPIEDAIQRYVKFTEVVFSSTQFGRGAKFDSITFEDAFKKIAEEVLGGSDERMMDTRPNACKT